MIKVQNSVRLQKVLAQAGIDSRRKCEQLILEGKIEVNGKIVHKLGTRVDPAKDHIFCYGQRIHVPSKSNMVYILLNKPKGYITSLHDEKGRPTVIELLPPSESRIFPVGRLDYQTEGLLLLTNDGELCYSLTHPKHRISRTYLVKVRGILNEASLGRLRKGIHYGQERMSLDSIRVIRSTPQNSWASVVIHEGKNNEIRKVFQAIGHSVLKLKRTKFAFLNLGTSRPGEYRFLSPDEVGKLKSLFSGRR
jgi:pseudouridine synthase